jgi:hypothetical protein
MAILRVNGKWKINQKNINDCFGYEKQYFISFLKYMKESKESEELFEKSNFKISKDKNYQFKNLG